MKKLFLIAVLTAAAAAGYCNGEAESFEQLLEKLLSEEVPLISTEELQELIDSEADFYLIDARETVEYEISRIEGAVYAGFDNFAAEKIEEFPKTAKIIIYCSVGYRSGRIGEKLLSMGWSRVYNLYGGIFQWRNEDRPLYGETGTTEAVHGFSEEWSRWLTDQSRIVF